MGQKVTKKNNMKKIAVSILFWCFTCLAVSLSAKDEEQNKKIVQSGFKQKVQIAAAVGGITVASFLWHNHSVNAKKARRLQLLVTLFEKKHDADGKQAAALFKQLKDKNVSCDSNALAVYYLFPIMDCAKLVADDDAEPALEQSIALEAYLREGDATEIALAGMVH